jgi:hypothetical protein
MWLAFGLLPALTLVLARNPAKDGISFRGIGSFESYSGSLLEIRDSLLRNIPYVASVDLNRHGRSHGTFAHQVLYFNHQDETVGLHVGWEHDLGGDLLGFPNAHAVEG